jgi:phenylpyruvate tautomerase PptA (4-oxalocrotonate tautomerase family)
MPDLFTAQIARFGEELFEKSLRAVTAPIVDTLKVKPESVRVILTEVRAEHRGIGDSSAKELGR